MQKYGKKSTCANFSYFFFKLFFPHLFFFPSQCVIIGGRFCCLSNFALAPERAKKYIKCEKNVKKTCVYEKKVVILHSILVNLMLINS